MRWGSKITDTAKISHKGRLLFLEKADALLYALQRLRQRAITYATPNDIGILATVIPLPKPAESELQDLEVRFPDDLHQTSELGWTTHAITRERGAMGDSDSWPANSSTECKEEGWLTIEDTWLEVLNTAPETSDAFQHLADIVNNAETTNHPRPCERCGDREAGCNNECDGRDQTSDSTSPVSDQGSQPVEERDGDDGRTAGKAKEQHVLLAPWAETFAGNLEQYLDELEAPGCNPVLDMPEIPVQNGHTALKLGALLARLQRDIDDVARHRTSLSLTIRDARQSLRCNQSRWERGTRIDAGDITLVMKSRGLGSPLVESITIDDPWLARAQGDVDGWDSLPDVKPRRRLCGQGSADFGGRGAEVGTDAKTARHVRW
ncbi:hypothetical protein VFPFJ_01753 [Purpureocillium lilacinum]|uniref:Uncharacterized protein n=2 Tax=Purpureocillium lilacinum TaxID=33203 RepID=A0A179HRU1_PURLI|nr:hypothetical protein VFPFJ_01753 [Purpureocillium lilacinum]KAK4084152.1 hypothetical protein Purlil1_10335 [Purpureocillium lilacinum]OAQ71541.1 hypothetical protein VFPBJ_10320 [Purpureocillium lilacinum]OAQ92592.1 hypothetical protein VFPFJ_01753 [Purpureocillium lilacinum]PWI75472.1 hypothetical protein PCL_06130 [Purpureocillium lilacinum]GJN83000.1 hypothetical protein PLIIFM63780_006546 [Purpureocillium lilacinum]